LNKGKKLEKIKKENIGHVLPNIVKNKLREKELKIICIKGGSFYSYYSGPDLQHH